jgi:prepilin-type N-terminal cleavage/methylation domain-containing protein
MGCAHKQNQDGFTLVEISIVMIIVGLLIGGTFGGMKLIENMQVNRTVQDLKAIESAALTFKDTYGRLPGDMPNTAARLPNCTVAPCAAAGNGNRSIDTVATWDEALTDTMEKFTFWSHLAAADLLSVGIKNTTDMTFGEGQPDSPLGGGYRLIQRSGSFAVANTYRFDRVILTISTQDSSVFNANATSNRIDCSRISSIDQKVDDGFVYDGFIQGWICGAVAASSPYILSYSGFLLYDIKGF